MNHIALYYIPSALLLIVYLSVRNHDRRRQAMRIGPLVALVVLVAAIVTCSVLKIHRHPAQYVVGYMNTLWLTGPALLLACRYRWKPIWPILCCIILPVPSAYVGFAMLMSIAALFSW